MSHIKFTGKIIMYLGITLHQIQATRDLPNGIKKGVTGGI